MCSDDEARSARVDRNASELAEAECDDDDDDGGGGADALKATG
jgi:hypothetical protein